MPGFAELLTAYMARTGIGDAELARRIGVSRLTLIRWREGVTSRPRHREDVVRCAEVLRLTAEERNELLLVTGYSPDDTPVPVAPSPAAQPDDLPAEEVEPLEPAHRPWRERRGVRIAGASGAVLAAAVGAGVWVLTLLNGPAYPAAAQGESLIVIAPFVNYTVGQQGYNVRGRLRHGIDREIRAAGLARVRTVEWPEEIDGATAAAVAGRRSGATIVIWGEYDSGRVMATLTIPKGHPEPHDQQVVDIASSPSELPATINLGLTEEVRYVALLTLGQLYLEQQEFDRAKTVLIQAMARPPSEPDALASLLFRLGRAYQGGDLADLDEAISLYSQVLDIEPRSVDAYNNRAVAYLDRGRDGDADRALADLTRAVTISPGRAATYLNRAVAYMDRGRDGDLDQAVADLSEALEIDSKYARAYVNRAVVYLDRGASGDLDRAFDDLEEAIAIEPELAAAYLNRGNAYVARDGAGDLELGVEDFSRAIGLAPDSPTAYFNRGLVYSALEDWSRSMADLRRAQKLSPDDSKFNRTLCWQLAVRRQPEEAMPYCEIAMATGHAESTRDSRGFVYAVMGRADEAIADFEAFLEWVDASPKETCRTYYRPSRLAWIEALRSGQNPFDAETLRGLRARPTTARESPC